MFKLGIDYRSDDIVYFRQGAWGGGKCGRVNGIRIIPWDDGGWCDSATESACRFRNNLRWEGHFDGLKNHSLG